MATLCHESLCPLCVPYWIALEVEDDWSHMPDWVLYGLLDSDYYLGEDDLETNLGSIE